MLVQGQQLAARIGVQLLEQQREGGPVAWEVFVLVAGYTATCLSKFSYECVGLGKEVRHQLVLVGHDLAGVVDRVLAPAEPDELARDLAPL